MSGVVKIISLGWGVQSWGLAAMSALGVLPKVDAAIHADTTHERSETYDFARKWTPWLEARGVRVVTVRGNRTDVAIEPAIYMPVFTSRINGTVSGNQRRQCTGHWKIRPIRQWLREYRNGGQVEQWLGITLDEVGRAKQADVKYICNTFPFLDMLDRPWRRGDVTRWLLENDLEVPVKSSCVFCPYRDRATWREIKMSGNGDWERAVGVDEAIRHKRPGYTCYVSSQRKPLTECDFTSPEDHGQVAMWEAEECSGNCFL